MQQQVHSAIPALALVALATFSGCKNSSDQGTSGSPGTDFGDGTLPQQFSVFIATDPSTGDRYPAVVDAVTGEVRSLADNLPQLSNGLLSAQGFGGTPSIFGPVLSPDGRILALTTVSGPTSEFRLVATADGRSVLLGTASGGPELAGGASIQGGDLSLAAFEFSDDSSWVLMRGGSFFDQEVTLVRSNGSSPQDVLINGEYPYAFTWIPGTNSFVAVGEDSAGVESVLRVTDADTGTSTDYSLGPESFVDRIVPSADGSKLAIAYGVGNEFFVRAGCLDLASGQFTPMNLGTEDVYDEEMVISEDGERMAVAVIDEVTNEDARVYIARTSDGTAVRVDPGGTLEDAYAEALSFQPGGHALAFRGSFDDLSRVDLYLASFETQTVNLTAFVGEADVPSYSWAPVGSGASRHLGLVADALTSEFMLVDVSTSSVIATGSATANGADIEAVAFTADGDYLLAEAEAGSLGSGHHLLACPVVQDGTGVSELGLCTRGTLRDLEVEGVVPATDRGFGGLGRIEGSSALVWRRDLPGIDAQEFVLGSASLPGTVGTLSPVPSGGAPASITAMAVRGEPFGVAQ